MLCFSRVAALPLWSLPLIVVHSTLQSVCLSDWDFGRIVFLFQVGYSLIQV